MREMGYHIAEHVAFITQCKLMHAGRAVPELVDARQQRHCAVPQVARMVHLPVLHLHLHVLEPAADNEEIKLQPAPEMKIQNALACLCISKNFVPFLTSHSTQGYGVCFRAQFLCGPNLKSL